MKNSLVLPKNNVLEVQKVGKKNWYKSSNIAYFSLDEVKMLIENLLEEPYYEAFFSVLYESGARESELLSCRVKDFDPKTSLLSLKTLKQRGNKPIRIVKLSTTLSSILLDFILKNGLSEEDYLFAKGPGLKHIHRSNIYARFNKLVLSTLGQGYSDRSNPHALRHSRAIHFLTYSKNSNIALLSKFLGHSSIANTMIYLRYTNKELNNTLDEVNGVVNLFE